MTKSPIQDYLDKWKANQPKEAKPIDELPIEARAPKPISQAEIVSVPQAEPPRLKPGRKGRSYQILSVESLTKVPPMPQAKFKGRVRSEGLKKAMREIVKGMKP